MRICFLCIGYEPGRDGVGDYVRAIVENLPADFVAHVIALNDPLVSAAETSNAATRIPSRLPVRERYDLAGAAIEAFGPDIVSLHLVCWGFGFKGVVTREAALLKRLVGGRGLHIMFHEPWVRLSKHHRDPRSLLWALVGQAQRRSIMRLVNVLRPRLRHTSTVEYQRLFTGAKIDVGILPIFSAIKPVPGDGWQTVRSLARQEGQPDPDRKEDYLVVGLFGAIRDRWDAIPLLRRLDLSAQTSGRRLLLVTFGHGSALGAEMVASWERAIPRLTVLRLGGQSAAALSQVLASCDIGLGHQLITAMGHSSTTAAMLEHGLPVIAAMGGTRDEDDPFIRRWSALIVDEAAIEETIRPIDRTGPTEGYRQEVVRRLTDEFQALSIAKELPRSW